MTDFELICVGFFIGIFFSMIMIGVGVAYDTRFIKRELGNDTDMRIYIPKRSRDRSSYNRFDKPLGHSRQEMMIVLEKGEDDGK